MLSLFELRGYLEFVKGHTHIHNSALPSKNMPNWCNDGRMAADKPSRGAERWRGERERNHSIYTDDIGNGKKLQSMIHLRKGQSSSSDIYIFHLALSKLTRAGTLRFGSIL